MKWATNPLFIFSLKIEIPTEKCANHFVVPMIAITACMGLVAFNKRANNFHKSNKKRSGSKLNKLSKYFFWNSKHIHLDIYRLFQATNTTFTFIHHLLETQKLTTLKRKKKKGRKNKKINIEQLTRSSHHNFLPFVFWISPPPSSILFSLSTLFFFIMITTKYQANWIIKTRNYYNGSLSMRRERRQRRPWPKLGMVVEILRGYFREWR